MLKIKILHQNKFTWTLKRKPKLLLFIEIYSRALKWYKMVWDHFLMEQ